MKEGLGTAAARPFTGAFRPYLWDQSPHLDGPARHPSGSTSDSNQFPGREWPDGLSCLGAAEFQEPREGPNEERGQ